MRHAVVLLTVAACGTPSPQLLIALAGPPSQACPSTECAMVPLACDAVMGIRIFDPKQPDTLLVNQCDKISPNKDGNICSFKSIGLAPVDLPIKDLEVQVTVYPMSAATVDANKNYVCPAPVQYSDATNLPIEHAPAPALGGRGYYHPGDAEVIVTIGCTDLAALSECVARRGTQIAATVTDFSTRLPVIGGPQGASQLRVAVGEPQPFNSGYLLDPVDEIELTLHDPNAVTPSWTGEIDTTSHSYVCLDVLQFGIETTPVLQCTSAKGVGDRLDLGGIRLARDDLRSILRALGNFDPVDGLTVGIVLDGTWRGAPGYEVKPSSPEVQVTYLAGGMMFGGSQTTDTGIFVSKNAPFGTVFSTIGGTRPTMSAVGGNVAGKITVVILPPAGSS